jgi:hypothetical protein
LLPLPFDYSFCCWPVAIAVWKHPSENGPAHYSIRVDRSFRKDGRDIESTAYLRDGDLLRAHKLLSQVDDWIEQDKAKQRSAHFVSHYRSE